MPIRYAVFLILVATAGAAAHAQSGTYASTFEGYQPWRDGSAGDWRALNRTVATSGDAHAGHGTQATAPAVSHDHGTANADHGKPGHDMRAMHERMHGKGTDATRARTKQRHEATHGDGAHDHRAHPEKKP